MPSRNRTLLAATLVALAVAVLAYSLLVASQVLLGGLLAALLVLVAAAVRGRDDDPTLREVAVWVVVGGVAVYGGITDRLLTGVLVAAVVYLVAWVTDPERERPVR